ncbi:MAG: rod shape-determining protein MreD [Desulfotomaculaceae bacterium]|nr:rod shape-determining protein MreD [Desulfotomaculaceae bacterium]
MRFVLYPLLFGVIIILQSTVLENVAIAGIKPDLVMLIVILNSFFLGTRAGAFLGFTGGIVEDLFLGSYIGLNALAKMTAGYLAGAAGGRLYRENIPIATIVIFFTSLAGLMVNYLLLLYLDITIAPLHALLRVALPTAAYTALLAPFVFWRIFRYNQNRSREL